MLGLSEGAVRGLVHRARATLRAAATALTPSPLLNWALSAGGGSTALTGPAAEVGAGGSIGLAGALVKAGVTAITAGVLAGGLGALHLHPHTGSRHPHLKVRAGASREPPSGEGHSGAPTTRAAGSEISLAAVRTGAAHPGILTATRTGQVSHPRTGSRRTAAHHRSSIPHRLAPRAPTLAPPTGNGTPLRIPSAPSHPPAAQNPAPAVPPPTQYPKPANPAPTQQTGTGSANGGERHDTGGDGSQGSQTSDGGGAGGDSDSGSAGSASSGGDSSTPSSGRVSSDSRIAPSNGGGSSGAEGSSDSAGPAGAGSSLSSGRDSRRARTRAPSGQGSADNKTSSRDR